MKKNIEILEGNVFKNLFLFTVPIALTAIMQLLYNAADIVVVGRFAGSNSLGACGSATSLINLMIALFLGISTGTNVCISKYIGMKDQRKRDINKAVHTSIFIGIFAGIILAISGIIFAKNILSFMNTPTDILKEATLYLRIIFIGIPALVTFNFCAAIFRATGDAKTPFAVLTISGIVNFLLNLFFVIICKMKAEGVGIATTVSQYLGIFLIMRALQKLDNDCKFNFKDLCFDKGIAFKIFKIGLPASIQGLIFNISNLQVQSAINSFGAKAIAGNSAAFTLEGFVYMSGNSVYQALITFIGQNYGAKDFKRVKKIAKTGYVEALIISLFVTSIFVIFAHPLLSIYTPGDTEVINYGMIRVKYVVALQFLCALMEVSVGILRGLGVSLLPMLVSIIGVCGVRMVWLLTVFPVVNTLDCVYISYPLSWFVTGLIHIVCVVYVYKSKKKKYEERLS